MQRTGPALDRPQPIDSLLSQGLVNKPDEPAVVDPELTLSWRELDQMSTRLAANYLEQGLRPGDRIASLMPNRAVLIVHYLACLKAGLVANPLSYQYTATEISHAIEDVGASALVAHAERDADVAAAAAVARLSVAVMRYCDAAGAAGEFNELLVRQPGGKTLQGLDPGAPAFIIHTSGSTGHPKGVVHSAEGFGWALASITAGYAVTSGDVTLPCSSVSRGGGIHMSFATLAAGGRVVLPWSTDADELLPLMRAYQPTIMGMLPAALFRLVRHKEATASDFASLRIMLSGGDKVPPELEDEFRQLAHFDIQESYGVTELGIVTHSPPGKANRPGAVGKPNPGFSLSLRDEAGHEVDSGREGRLFVKSPTMTTGYWHNPEASAKAIQSGWFDTGDMMRCDDDGYFWFTGRRSQIIVHDGHNIGPQEVEAALLEHPAVALAGVVGIRNLLHGENVRAYITLREGVDKPSDNELFAFARQRVGYKAPEDIVTLDVMPLIGDGKIDRVRLKAMTAEEKQANQH